MDDQEILFKIHNNPLFKDINEEQLAFILSHSTQVTKEAKEFVIRENELGSELYFILEGSAKVLKEEGGKTLQIATLGPGELIGEMALIDRVPRSASVQAENRLHLLLLPFNHEVQASEKEALKQITLNISAHLSQKLRTLNELTVQSMKTALRHAEERVESGKFFFLLLIIVSLWVLALSFSQTFVAKSGYSAAVSWSVILAVVISNIYLVKYSIHPPTFFGLTAKHWKRDLIEGVLFTVPLLIGATLLKWILITHVPFWQEVPLFEPVKKGAPLNPLLQVIAPLIYVALTPLQEFIARGVMQSCVKELLVFHPIFWSIVLSNLIFAIFHTHISSLFALASFVVGLFWGWLRYRQDSLTGAIVSHALVGGWCLSLLNFDRLLK